MTKIIIQATESFSESSCATKLQASSQSKPTIFFLAFAKLLHIEFRLFKFIDFLINLFQFRVTRCTKIVTICSSSDLSQSLFINLHRYIDILYRVTNRIRIWCHTIRAHTNGINTNTEALCYFSSRQWRNISRIISTIGKQNNNFRLGFAIFQTSHSISNSHTYCSTVSNKSALDSLKKIQ